MLSHEEAFERMMARARVLGEETVELRRALRRVLAVDVSSDVNMPPFDKSAMDGYACRRADLANPLEVVEEIYAGRVPTKVVGPGQCSKIMTGAPVPDGAGVVVMVEMTEVGGDGKVIFKGGDTRDNICQKGEDIVVGQALLGRGTLIGAAHVATLATAGVDAPRVTRQPRVAVISTGSELVEVGVRPTEAFIRDSNSHQLVAQAEAMGVPVTRMGVVGDTEDEIRGMVERARADHDVILISGGVSMGDLDLVPGVLEALGFEFEFESVAMQPGKPTIFGHDGERYCFGMPGNPVSGFVVFERMVKPFLYALQGHEFKPTMVRASLKGGFKRRKAKRQSAIPVRFVDSSTVEAISYHGSAHINSYTEADGTILVPVGTLVLEDGGDVHVRLL